MKMLRSYVLFAIFCLPAFAESSLNTEAGVSYVFIRKARYETGSITTGVLSEDKSQVAPFVAIGHSFSESVSLRLSYQYIGNLNATTQSVFQIALPPGTNVPNPLIPNFTNQYHDSVHVLGLAPEFKWRLSPKLGLTFSPELNWAADRGTILSTEIHDQPISPFTAVAPKQASHTAENFSLGASAGVLWSLSERCSLAFSYRYTELQPSWNRQAHILSAALRWHF